MKSWESFFLLEPGAGHETHAVLLARAHRGASRLKVAARVLGDTTSAKAFAKSLGTYQLENALTQSLRLEGLLLPENGEVAALSPIRWLEASADARPLDLVCLEWEERGLELEGILLGAEERAAFFTFLRSSRTKEQLGPWQMALVFEHFSFPHHKTMNLLASTRRRV